MSATFEEYSPWGLPRRVFFPSCEWFWWLWRLNQVIDARLAAIGREGDK